MSWIFLRRSDILWIIRFNCCVNSNIRQRQLQFTRPLWIELSHNPFPYRPELARKGRNVRTLGKDHSSSVVRIPTHTLVSYFPRVVSYGSQSHALLSSSQSIWNEDTSPLPVSHTLLFQLSNSIKYFLTVKIESINHTGTDFGPDVESQKQHLSDSSIYFKILSYR